MDWAGIGLEVTDAVVDIHLVVTAQRIRPYQYGLNLIGQPHLSTAPKRKVAGSACVFAQSYSRLRCSPGA